MPKPRELFLSHAGRDRRFVEKLADLLRFHKIRSWHSEKHIAGAQQWHDEIGKALERCDWFVVILSPAAVASEWVKRELVYALNHHRYNNRIVPVVLKHCESERLSWTLDAFQRVDFSSDFDSGCRELLKIWRVRYRGVTGSKLRQPKPRGRGR